ncbi:sporulation protein YtxC [Haloimpatiens sp. FM7315]|uniref:sporulation protein YtxC n=1 Tax=Haloimpatiens sp. FM7315 TaxID=3298609 RepID=UPI003709C7A8
MLILSIVYKGHKEKFLSDIYDMKRYLDSRKIYIGILEDKETEFNFIKIFSKGEKIKEEDLEIICLNVSERIYECLITKFYNVEIDEILNEKYFFLNSEEQESVKIKLFDRLIKVPGIDDKDEVYCVNRINEIKKDIVEVLKKNRELNLDGYLTFRTKNIEKKVLLIIDKLVEKYMAEKEYDEFIKLLKYFVDMQESKINKVNIIIDEKGDISLKDNKGSDILMELLGKDLIEEEEALTKEDVIMSSLVTSSPKLVMIHGSNNIKNKEFLNTVEKVFTGRVKYCKGCKLCQYNLCCHNKK